jgi:hypothetical protein
MATKYIGLIADCSATGRAEKTYQLRGGRKYASREAVRAAAKRWEAAHPQHVLVETKAS